jgi:hypothetical protein
MIQSRREWQASRRALWLLDLSNRDTEVEFATGPGLIRFMKSQFDDTHGVKHLRTQAGSGFNFTCVHASVARAVRGSRSVAS